jgi:hypothetical protein
MSFSLVKKFSARCLFSFILFKKLNEKMEECQ